MPLRRPQFIGKDGKVLMVMDEEGLWHPVDDSGAIPAPPPPVVYKLPTSAEMAANLTRALAEWTRHGFPVATQEVRDQRQAICDGCEWWESNAMFGTGRCRRCGCSKLKLALATSVCPVAKWGSVSGPQKENDKKGGREDGCREQNVH
jgi:hypothetical protein